MKPIYKLTYKKACEGGMVFKVKYRDIICMKLQVYTGVTDGKKGGQSRKKGDYGVCETLLWFFEGCYY